MHLLEGPDLGHSIGEGKSETPCGVRTHNLLIMRRALYSFATTATRG